MLKVLLFIWQLPQCLTGFIWTRFTKDKKVIEGIPVWFTKCFRAGVSLGEYIILDLVYKSVGPIHLAKTVKHEYGHTKQSRMLGVLYLIVVGIPSATRNVIDRIFHKNWSYEKSTKWYYGHYPENWADKLGGVKDR